MGEKSIKIIKTASLLYDIGKLIIPDHILNKPAPLNQEEWEIIKRNAENSIRKLGMGKDIQMDYPESKYLQRQD